MAETVEKMPEVKKRWLINTEERKYVKKEKCQENFMKILQGKEEGLSADKEYICCWDKWGSRLSKVEDCRGGIRGESVISQNALGNTGNIRTHWLIDEKQKYMNTKDEIDKKEFTHFHNDIIKTLIEANSRSITNK